MTNFHPHTFHVPVMGIGYTIDSPLKLAHLGITSVVSLVDDMLMEKMREFHTRKAGLPFKGITARMDDFRAERITAFLDMMDAMVKQKVETLKSSLQSNSGEAWKYFELLPDTSLLKKKFLTLRQHVTVKELRGWMHDNIWPGQIDVNIMTKLDKENYQNNEKLPVAYNDAHAALRGFAKSNLTSSLVLSAGMNPRLFSYLEEWDDFYPDETGYLRKKVTLKVSDYRSALVQGKMLAKKGIWVSEYRIESGLNCGGHAFATQGNLMGPVLEEFKKNRESLITTQFETLQQALAGKNRTCPELPPQLRISAQGGVGTSAEHEFLLDHYGMDSVGWGTPFMLVPEAVSIDRGTIGRLSLAREKDLYLSNISPLGVPFNNLKGNTKDVEKDQKIRDDVPGSSCIKHYCSLNKEFSDKPVCTASRGYQRKKLASLERSSFFSANDFREAKESITEKSCICVGLGTSALLANNIDTSLEGSGVSVCPGPNMAYFSREVSLKEMMGHIYGTQNIMERNDRPNMFIRELELYVDFLENKIQTTDSDSRESAKLVTFGKALEQGVEYYRNLFSEHFSTSEGPDAKILQRLEQLEMQIKGIEERLRCESSLI
ncbi:MAG: hypothetical protein R6U46_12630 [Marinilabilia sp.]